MRFTRVLITTTYCVFFLSSTLSNAQIKSSELSLAKTNNIKAPQGEASELTLENALANVERYSTSILAADAYVESFEGRKESARAIPNPELSFEMEKFAGTGSSKGYSRSELRTSLSQTLELGGKRGKRVALANAESDASKLSATLIRIEVKHNVQILFTEVLRLQELKGIYEERQKAAVDFLESASKRFDAGIASPTEKAKAQVSLESARLDLQRSQIELENSKSKLSVLWGEASPSFTSAKGDLTLLPDVPSKEDLIANLDNITQVQLRQKEMDVRREGLALARSQAIPDITVSGGVLMVKEDNSKSALLGLSMPIPIFQRNGGGILEASKLLEQAKALSTGETQLTSAQIVSAYQTYIMRRDEAKFLQTSVLKSANQAMDFVMQSFRLGRLNYLEVIESQRTLFETKLQFLDATFAAQSALIELEKLTKLEFHFD